MRRILVAFDFSEPSRRALEWARMLRARLAVAVTVVHVADEDQPGAHERRIRALEGELRRAIGEVFGPEESAIASRVASGRASERLIELALELDADLVIAGSTGKSATERVLLGSVTEDLVRGSAVPVMIVH